MKHRSRARSSSLFLMELILAILFFSVASAVCVQIFVTSHMLSNDSRALNHGVNECANLAEIIDTADGIEDCLLLLKKTYPGETFSNGGSADGETGSEADLLFGYDDNFSACGEENSSYILSLHLSQVDYTLTARMDFSETSGESIYQLETKYHIARRISDETK